MYKLTESNIQKTLEDGSVLSIPQAPGNRHFAEFKRDVAEHGLGIIEGEDDISPSYRELRAAEYPSVADQLDKIYHEGVDAWKADIKAIKDAHPKVEQTKGIKLLPAWVTELAEQDV